MEFLLYIMVSGILGAISEGVLNHLNDEDWMESALKGFIAGFSVGIASYIFSKLGIKA